MRMKLKLKARKCEGVRMKNGQRKRKLWKALWSMVQSSKMSQHENQVKSVHHSSKLIAPAPRSPSAPIHQCGPGTGLPAAAPMAFPFELKRRAHVSVGFGAPTMLAVGLFGTGLPFAVSLESVIVNLLEME